MVLQKSAVDTKAAGSELSHRCGLIVPQIITATVSSLECAFPCLLFIIFSFLDRVALHGLELAM